MKNEKKLTGGTLAARSAVRASGIAASMYGMAASWIGAKSLTYFTFQSNILAVIVLAAFLVLELCLRADLPNWLYIVKFMMTISITLTLLVFMFLLAPTMQGGFLRAYFGGGAGSFGVHFLCPVLAIADFLLFSSGYRSKGRHCLYAMVPPLCYVVYVVIAGQLGERWGNMIAPYNFLNYAAPAGWFGFAPGTMSFETLGIGTAYMIAVLLLIFIGIGYLFLALQKRIRK